MTPLGERLAARIAAEGALEFATWMDTCLYDPDGGFYATGGGAGRRADFLTSAEVGPLFGAVLARGLDRWWGELGRPEPFWVLECGAGAGTLARSVLHAAPACGPVLRYVAVERSAALRARLPDHPQVEGTAELPPGPIRGVILANELLDNLAIDLYEWRGGAWWEVRVATAGAGGFDWVLVPPAVPPPGLAPGPWPEGTRLPRPVGALAWLVDVRSRLAGGRVVAFDYGSSTVELAARPWTDWLRTYRGHGRGGSPLEAPGSQDITCEVDLDQLAAAWPPVADRAQADFLRAHGIEELVAEGRRTWQQRAHLGDLAAVRGRSRIREAEALCDPSGLGSFRVLEWEV